MFLKGPIMLFHFLNFSQCVVCMFGDKTIYKVTQKIKKYPMCTMKYTAVFLMLWAYISAGGHEYLVQTHGIMDSIKYQQIKNQ